MASGGGLGLCEACAPLASFFFARQSRFLWRWKTGKKPSRTARDIARTVESICLHPFHRSGRHNGIMCIPVPVVVMMTPGTWPLLVHHAIRPFPVKKTFAQSTKEEHLFNASTWIELRRMRRGKERFAAAANNTQCLAVLPAPFGAANRGWSSRWKTMAWAFRHPQDCHPKDRATACATCATVR